MSNRIKLDKIKVLVTSECNLNCTHCFRSFDKHKYFIPNHKLIELVDFAIDTRCESISFSGGEFFSHPFAFDLLNYCYEKKIKVKILTNAVQIGDIGFYKKYIGTDLISFQISLDGMKEKHDARRGSGIFERVMCNVEKLKKLGLHITVSMTVDQDNMYDVLDVLNLSVFDKHNFVPVAFAGEKTKQGRPDMSDDLYAEYENIIRILYDRQAENIDVYERCRMFPHQLGIKYDGTVYPCAVARDYGIFCMGNINDNSITDIVNDFISTNEAKELLEYKSNDFEQCKNCKVSDTCNRGCRARAYKFFGKLQAPDPFCCKLYEIDHSDIPINCVFWGER